MEAVTLVISLVFIALALRSKPGAAVGWMVAAMFFWPEYLRIPVGPIKFSAPRLVAVALLIQFFIQQKHRKTKWQLADLAVLIGWIWSIIANVAAKSEFTIITTLIGNIFQVVIPYAVTRMAFSDPEQRAHLLKPLIITSIWVGLMGMLESLSSWSPYQKLMQFHAWLWFFKDFEYRMGLLRAQGSMAHPIYWGMSGFMLCVLVYSLRQYGMLAIGGRKKGLRIPEWQIVIAACFAFIAGFSAMSSGPMLACLIFVFLSQLQRMPFLIKPMLAMMALMSMVVEVASNRHFWNLIDYIALNPATAYYRTRLMEVAVMHVHEYWLFGLGGHAPVHWAAKIDGRGHVDLVNHFVILGTQSGILVLFCYLYLNLKCLRDNIKIFRRRRLHKAERTAAFSLNSGLIALALSSMSVGLFGTPLMLSHVVFAIMITNDPRKLAQRSQARQPVARHPASLQPRLFNQAAIMARQAQ